MSRILSFVCTYQDKEKSQTFFVFNFKIVLGRILYT